MNTNIGNAILTAAISVILGGAVSYILYMQTIGKWYSKVKNQSKHAKIKYWCGILSLIAITQGVIMMAGELIFSLTNNSEIKIDNIAKAVIVIVLYPIVFFIIAYIATLLVKENQITENLEEKKTITENKNIKWIIFLTLVVLGMLGIQVAPYLKANEKEKTFLVESCISCKDDGCKPTFDFIKFQVAPPFININYISDGIEKVNIYPESANDNCVIYKDKNFAFSCERLRDSGIAKLESSIIFDGKNTYQSMIKATFGEKIITSKQICQIK
jgi:hypothetical protein